MIAEIALTRSRASKKVQPSYKTNYDQDQLLKRVRHDEGNIP